MIPYFFASYPHYWGISVSNERFAEVSIYTADGKLASIQRYGQLRQGEERILDLHGQPSGVYVVRIHTAGADLTRKLLVP